MTTTSDVPPQPGDYGVQRTHGFTALAIKVATRSKFSHAFIVDYDGNVIEATPKGVKRNPLGVRDAIYSTDAIDVGTDERRRIVNDAVALIDTPYGWLDILSIGLLQYGIRPKIIRDRVERMDRLICSQVVDLAFSGGRARLVDVVQLAHGVHLFADKRLPMDVTPGDLAKRAGWR
jgi:hypothetical protein